MSPTVSSLRRSTDFENQLSIFPSDLGWFGIVGREDADEDRRLVALTFGHRTPGEVHERLLVGEAISRLTSPTDWWPDLRIRLQSYAAGGCEDFTDVTVVDSRTTSFQRDVVAAVRDVGYGETLSYADVAERAGSPRAARAVGHVMATNPVPIVIPCHRVIASGGRLGGYSAPSGLEMKQRLLAMEGSDSLALAGPGPSAGSDRRRRSLHAQ